MKALRLMVLGGGSSQESLLRRCRQLGWEIILVDQNPSAPGRRYADKFVQVSTFDIAGVEEAARHLRPESIVTVGSDQPVLTGAVVSERVGIPAALTPETAAKTTNKRIMKGALRDAGVPTVDYEVVGLKSSRPLPLPVVVKPLDSQGQRGVSLVTGDGEYGPAVEEALAYSREESVLVEAYYPSTEVTVSGWVSGGEVDVWSMTDRVTVSPSLSLGVCAAHRHPSIHAEEWYETVASASRRIVEAFGITEGPIYFQFLVGEEGVKANEVACRLGGAYEDESLPLVSGVDPIGKQLELCFRLARGEGDGASFGDAPTEAPGKAAGGYFSVPLLFCREGVIRDYKGEGAVASLPGVANCRFLLPLGTRIFPMRNSTQRVGYAVVYGGTKEAVNTTVERLFDSLAVSDTSGNNLLLDFRALCMFPEGAR
jgi:biotin carboxylase